MTVVGAAQRLSAGLATAYRDALGPDGVAFASPQIALVGAFSVAYLGGLLLTAGSIGDELIPVVVAMTLGFVGLLTGIGVVWSRRGSSAASPVPPSLWLLILGTALVAIGVSAMLLYLQRIGDIPLFMQSIEQGRVEAAERGGAALRVLGLLALPGCWLIVASAASRHSLPGLLFAAGAVAVVAGLQVLTANRSPAFQAIIVSLLVGLLAGGWQRLRWQALTVLGAVALVLILAAGIFGAYRLASVPFYGPPLPGHTVTKGPPPNYPVLTVIAIRGYGVVPVRNLVYTLDAIPERIGWRLGYTYLQPVLTTLPGKQVTFDQDLKAALGQVYAGGGTVPGMLGEAFANFGPAGWFAIPLVLASVTGWLYRRATERQSAALWALFGFAIFHACGSSLSGLFVASIFPFEAYAVLGIAAFIDWRLSRRSPAPAAPAPTVSVA